MTETGHGPSLNLRHAQPHRKPRPRRAGRAGPASLHRLRPAAKRLRQKGIGVRLGRTEFPQCVLGRGDVTGRMQRRDPCGPRRASSGCCVVEFRSLVFASAAGAAARQARPSPVQQPDVDRRCFRRRAPQSRWPSLRLSPPVARAWSAVQGLRLVPARPAGQRRRATSVNGLVDTGRLAVVGLFACGRTLRLGLADRSRLLPLLSTARVRVHAAASAPARTPALQPRPPRPGVATASARFSMHCGPAPCSPAGRDPQQTGVLQRRSQHRGARAVVRPTPRAMRVPASRRGSTDASLRGRGCSLQVLQLLAQPAVRVAQAALHRFARRRRQARNLVEREPALDVQQKGISLQRRHVGQRGDQPAASLSVDRRVQRVVAVVARRGDAFPPSASRISSSSRDASDMPWRDRQ